MIDVQAYHRHESEPLDLKVQIFVHVIQFVRSHVSPAPFQPGQIQSGEVESECHRNHDHGSDHPHDDPAPVSRYLFSGGDAVGYLPATPGGKDRSDHHRNQKQRKI